MSAWKLKATANSLPQSAFSIAAMRRFEANEYPINDKAIFGRDDAFCDYTLPWKHISRQHTEIKVLEDALEVRDLGSGNGTYINGKKISVAKAYPGDIITFDKVTLKVFGPQGAPREARPVPLDSHPVNATLIRPMPTRTLGNLSKPPLPPISKTLRKPAVKEYAVTFRVSDKTVHLLKGMVMGLGIAALSIGILAFIA